MFTMKLSNRDYCQLTEDERQRWDGIKEKEIIHHGKITIRNSYYHDYPNAVRHYLSLFPNNHLDIMILREKEFLKNTISKFYELLNNPANGERDVLNFIKDEKAYFIIGSILDNYHFGHHDAFVFPEFMLGSSYRVDYLVVGRASGGYEFVFIEIESIYGRVVQSNGNFGEVIRKGISQVCDWDEWIDSNYQTLSELFNRYKKPEDNLPDEFYKLDKSRVHYAVIAGRREHYNDKTYRLRRKEREQRKITLLHYDNLIFFLENLVGKSTY